MTEIQENLPRELSDSKRRLLQRLAKRHINKTATAEIDRLPPGTPVALSPSQARIWFFCRMYPTSTEYNSFGSISFPNSADNARVEEALGTVLARHDAFRLRIFERDGEPLEEEVSSLPLTVDYHDLRELSVAAAAQRVEQIGSALASTPFRLDEPPLYRFSVMRLPEEKSLLVFVVHHIIADGWSVGIFCDEFRTMLDGMPLPLPPAVRFLDYIAWERRSESKTMLAAQMSYWSRKLGGVLPVLDLPGDWPRPKAQTRKGSVVPCEIPAQPIIQKLKELAGAENTTLFVALLAAYKALLVRLTKQTDLIVGAPFAGRGHPVTENIVGCFLKTVALRTELEGNPSFRTVMRRVRDTTLEAQDNQSIPFERIVAELKIPRELHYAPVFQTLFALQTTPSEAPDYAGAEFSNIVLDSESAKFDLTFALTETDSGVSGTLEYSSDLFKEETVKRYVEMYITLLSAMVEQPDRPISTCRLLTDRERNLILFSLNPYKPPQHPYRTMAQPFEEQVDRTPDAIALVGDEGAMTFSTLNGRANQLAHFLHETGRGVGSFVAVCMERSFDLVAALYGVAKSGATYVPLDPELPNARIGFMLEDTAPSLVLVDDATAARIPRGPWQVLSMNEKDQLWAKQPTENPPCEGPANHLAYLLYTTGSTGRPKAVAYPVDGAIAHILWLQKSYPFQPGDANVFKTSYGFDVSTWEIFWTLYGGGRLAVCRPAGHRDPHYLVEVIERNQVTTIFLVPSMLQVFLDEMPEGSCRSLRWVLCGGEPVTPRLRDVCHSRLGAQLVNVCGPTETGTVTDIIIPREPDFPIVPLGRPAENFRLYVLDEQLEVAPIGVPGEAYIAGETGLAQCYYARPELTAERFVPDLFGSTGGRMYRSGDVCRYRSDGVLEHLGRCDRQVKIRGMRVELAEIEAVLCEHATVAASAVIAVDDADGQRILAFVVPQDDQSVDPRALAEHAARILPRYMVPSSIVTLSKVPTTVNGKVDREALLGRWREAGTTIELEVVAPASHDEERLKGIFEHVLGCKGISVTDSFFDLGGHSLLVFKLIAACEKRCNFRPSVADIFSAPSVRQLSALTNSSNGRSGAGVLVPLVPNAGKPIIIFVHAASGSVLPFLEIAKRLGNDYSTFGLQTPETDGGNQSHPSIDHLASLYIEAVDGIRATSPLIIAGWSMGGCVGLEMTRKWRGRGIEVAALFMLDTWFPPEGDEAEAQRQTISEIDFLAFEGLAPVQPDESADAIARLDSVLHANRLAFLKYEPAWFDGEIDYLRAIDQFPDFEVKFPDLYWLADRGWGRRIRNVRVHDIAGNHFNLIHKSNAATLAETIRRIVEARLTFSIL